MRCSAHILYRQTKPPELPLIRVKRLPRPPIPADRGLLGSLMQCQVGNPRPERQDRKPMQNIQLISSFIYLQSCSTYLDNLCPKPYVLAQVEILGIQSKVFQDLGVVHIVREFLWDREVAVAHQLLACIDDGRLHDARLTVTRLAVVP